jgi:hypothetical protein
VSKRCILVLVTTFSFPDSLLEVEFESIAELFSLVDQIQDVGITMKACVVSCLPMSGRLSTLLLVLVLMFLTNDVTSFRSGSLGNRLSRAFDQTRGKGSNMHRKTQSPTDMGGSVLGYSSLISCQALTLVHGSGKSNVLKCASADGAILSEHQSPLAPESVSDSLAVPDEGSSQSQQEEVITFIRMAHLSESGDDFKFMKASDKIRILDEMFKLFQLNLLTVTDKINMLWTAAHLEVDEEAYAIKSWYQQILTSIMFGLNGVSEQDLRQLQLSPRSIKTFLIVLGLHNKLTFNKFTNVCKRHVTYLFEKVMSNPECSVQDFAAMCKSIRLLKAKFPVASEVHFAQFFGNPSFKDSLNVRAIGANLADILFGLKISVGSWSRMKEQTRNIILAALMTQLDSQSNRFQEKSILSPASLADILRLLGSLECRWYSSLRDGQKEKLYRSMQASFVKMNFHDFSTAIMSVHDFPLDGGKSV